MKHIGLTLLLTIGICLSNCSDDDLGCGNINHLPFFNIQAIENFEHNKINDGALELVQDNDVVSLDEYAGLSLRFEVEYIAFRSKSIFDFSLVNSLEACSPLPNGTEGSKEEKIESLEIITLIDFDDAHLAGSSISDLITIQGFEYEAPNTDEMSIDDYIAQNTLIESERFFIKPLKAPEMSEDFQVKLSIQLTGGEQYEESSTLIKLVN